MSTVYEIVRDVMHTKWDPIGIGASALDLGEYDSYVPGLCKLLESRSPEAEVFNYLWTIETECLGLSGDRERTQQFAKWLCELKSISTGTV